MKDHFIPGLKASELFYHEVVHPILDEHFPGLKHAAGKLHRGSDVLGFDTPHSMDHDWGPSKLDLFLEEEACDQSGQKIATVMTDSLPHEFHDLPVDFEDPGIDGGTIKFVAAGPVSHQIKVTTVRRFFEDYIGLHPLDGLEAVDWLLIAPQFFRTIASGKKYHDGLNELRQARDTLAWYPHEIWLYLMACQWRKIDQEEPFMARCGDVGDDLGSRLIAARLILELMRLCFLMEKQYWPYAKWFGTAFSKLKCAEQLTPIFNTVHSAKNWRERENDLSIPYLQVAHMHNELAVTNQVKPQISDFHTRPYRVPQSSRFVDALYAQISSKAVKALPQDVGGVAQYVNSTDILDRPHRCKKLRGVYE